MQPQSFGRMASALLLCLACGQNDGDDAVAVRQQALCSHETIRVGVLIDSTSPARTNFRTAAELAGRQLNDGLAAAHSRFRVDVIISEFGAGQAVAKAIDLVNVDDVHAIVSDISGNTASVNGLNYESPSRINHHVVVTCYQCSSAFFNDPTQTNPGFADKDNWLFRTFFNATFESAVQVQLVLNRANQGDFNNDGFLKIVVYYDAFHLSAATTMPGILDALRAGPHSVELIAKQIPSDATSRASELAAVFDTAPDGHAPDAVYLAFLPGNAPEALSDYTAQVVSPKAPAQANNGVRRDFLLPSLLTAGGAGLQGSSVRVVASSPSGELFRKAFARASGGQTPELTSSFLYDAVVAPALAGLMASGAVTPERLRKTLESGSINAPGGKLIRPSSDDFAKAAQLIGQYKAINYDGASSPLDLTPQGEMYPDLVHWQIQNGRFVELEAYRCDPQHALCSVR
jgi:Periplasmic binding protein